MGRKQSIAVDQVAMCHTGSHTLACVALIEGECACADKNQSICRLYELTMSGRRQAGSVLLLTDGNGSGRACMPGVHVASRWARRAPVVKRQRSATKRRGRGRRRK